MFSLLMCCIALCSCNMSESEVMGPIKSPVVMNKEIKTRVSASREDGLTIAYESTFQAPRTRSASINEESCYFYIREDGQVVAQGHEGKPVKYYPVYENGFSMREDLNKGSINTTPEDLVWSYWDNTTPKYIFDATGKDVSSLIVNLPDVSNMLNGSNLNYDPSNQTILWYSAKYSDKFWHVDGIIIDKVDSINDKISVEFDPGIAEDLICKADDFLVRVNGVYQEIEPVKVNSASFENILMSRDGFKAIIEHAEKQDVDVEYTYEIYLWASVGYETLFNNTDIQGAVKASQEYDVRYNVYKGLSGHNDTPYIKISLHVVKKSSSENEI